MSRRADLRGDDFGVAVNVDMVLVAVVILPSFLRPTCVDIFLCSLGWGLAPVNWHGVLFDNGIVFASVALNWHRDEGGIDDLSAFEFNAQIGQCLVDALEQGDNKMVGLEQFAERPDGAGIRHIH